MPLDGAAWAGKAQALFGYLAGEEPLEIQRWDPETETAIGDPLPFVHDEETTDLEAVESGTLEDEELVIFTSAPLEAGVTYRYGSKLYTSEESETDQSATASATWPCQTVLRKHAT